MTQLPGIAGLLGLGITFIVVCFGIKSGWLTPNIAIGVRTRATLASEGAWRAAHEKVFNYLVAAAIVTISFASIIIAMELSDFSDGAKGAVTLTGLFLTLPIIIVGGLASDRAAKRHNELNS